ncbi:MAG: biotin--[acetyl-CoA-carboxylase] ligase, partial [Myxococcaceae bacterium]|nr:biotin--[acetyl-CoA-carboxylase] ligase [Myxococcaceae bacterium]
TRLESWLDRHAEQGFGPVREAWKRLSSTLGQDVLVRTDRAELRGRAVDIDVSGALLVRREDGTLERVLAGDVEQLRPRKDPLAR